MAQFPALTLWTDPWIADTHHLSRLARGTYFDLLVLMWRTTGCSVPNDDEWLAARLHMTLDEVKNELRPIVVEFCQTDGNRIWQKRLRIEFERASKFHRAQSVRAKSAWDKKKNSTPAMPTYGIARAGNATLEEEKKDSEEGVFAGRGECEGGDLFAPIYPPRAKRAKRAAGAKTPLPADWQLTESDRDYATGKGWPEARINTEAERFKLHWLADGKAWTDWHLVWCKWVMSPIQNQNGGDNGYGRRHGSVLDAGDRLEEKLRSLGATGGYVPGSSGPRPLAEVIGPTNEMGEGLRHRGLKLIPKG